MKFWKGFSGVFRSMIPNFNSEQSGQALAVIVIVIAVIAALTMWMEYLFSGTTHWSTLRAKRKRGEK